MLYILLTFISPTLNTIVKSLSVSLRQSFTHVSSLCLSGEKGSSSSCGTTSPASCPCSAAQQGAVASCMTLGQREKRRRWRRNWKRSCQEYDSMCEQYSRCWVCLNLDHHSDMKKRSLRKPPEMLGLKLTSVRWFLFHIHANHWEVNFHSARFVPLVRCYGVSFKTESKCCQLKKIHSLDQLVIS